MPAIGKSYFAKLYPNVFDLDYLFHPRYYGSWLRADLWKTPRKGIENVATEYMAVGMAGYASSISQGLWDLPATLRRRCYTGLKETMIKVANAEAPSEHSSWCIFRSDDALYTGTEVSIVSSFWREGFTQNFIQDSNIEGEFRMPRVYFCRTNADEIVELSKARHDGKRVPYEVAARWTKATERWGTQAFDVIVNLGSYYMSDVLTVIDDRIRFVPGTILSVRSMSPLGSSTCMTFDVISVPDLIIGTDVINSVELMFSEHFWSNVLTYGLPAARKHTQSIPLGKRLVTDTLNV